MTTHYSSRDPHQLTEVESALTKIHPGSRRERRILILGDRAVERAFYDYLSAAGCLYYQGGMPVITASVGGTIRSFRKFARRMPDISAVHALNLTLRRDGLGLFGTLKAAIRNFLPGFRSRHMLYFLVVGKQATADTQLTELGSLLRNLEEKGFVNLDKVPMRQGHLVFNPKRPLKLVATATLYDVISFVRRKSEAAATMAAQHAYASAQATAYSAQDDHGGFPAPMYAAVNPASGLPMVDGMHHDVAGNTFGFNNADLQHESP